MKVYAKNRSYYIDLTIPNGTRKTGLRLLKQKGLSEVLARDIYRLLESAKAGRLQAPVGPPWVQKKLVEWAICTPPMTLRELLDGYYVHHAAGVSAKQHRQIRRALEMIFEEMPPDTGWEDLTPKILKTRLDALVPIRGWSAQTYNHHRAYLRAFRSYIRDYVGSTHDPVDVIPAREGEEVVTRRALSLDEWRRLSSYLMRTEHVLRTLDGRERELIYRAAVETGLRANELRELRGRHIRDGYCYHTAKATKNKKATRIPLTERTFADLSRAASDEPVFRYIPIHVAQMLRRDCKAAGVDTTDVDFHGLRHTHGTWLSASGTPFRTVQALMRHSKPQLTARYSKSSLDEERSAIEKTFRAPEENAVEAAADAVSAAPDWATKALEIVVYEVGSDGSGAEEPVYRRGCRMLDDANSLLVKELKPAARLDCSGVSSPELASIIARLVLTAEETS